MGVMRTLDLETTIYTSYKRKANPFDPRNWVVIAGWKDKGQDPCIIRFGSERPPAGWAVHLFDGVSLLVLMNGKFDLHHIMQDEQSHESYMAWVAGGGRIWDIQLAEYLLNGMGQKDQILSMDEIAPRYGGTVKIDEVKALWEAGIQTHEIEPALLERYLCGGHDETGAWVDGDLGNTELIAVKQIERARREGSLNKILLDMDALIATTEMEFNGAYINMGKALAQRAVVVDELAKATAEVQSYVPSDLPFEFNWNSRFHKSALIFGGNIKYDGYEYQLKDGGWVPHAGHPEQAYAQKEEAHFVLKDGTTQLCDHFGMSDPDNDPRVRIASGKNAGEFKTKRVKVDDRDKPKKRLTKYTYIFPGYTVPEKRWEGSDPGVYSTAADVIEELAPRNIPFLKALARMVRLQKDLGTYYYSEDEDGTRKGMLTLVDEDGIVHHKLNHTSTVTSRLTSSDPNLQNVSGGEKSDVKDVFESRFEEGVIIQSDFTSLEVYIQAYLTECPGLIQALIEGLDMHCKRVSLNYGLPYEEVKRLVEAKDPLWVGRRKAAKVFSFQRAYGAGAKKVAETTGMSVEEVESLIAAEDAEWPEINAFYEGLTAVIKASRKPTSTFIQHPDIPGITCQLGRGYYRTPDGQLFSWLETPAPEYLVKRGISQSFSPTEIKNYPVQGTGGTWMKAAMGLAVREFYRRRNFNGEALLINTVHDALYGDAAPTVAQEAALLIHACMEAASEYIEYTFDWPIPVPVPSETEWGPSMMDANAIPGIKAAARDLRLELRSRYMNDHVPSFEEAQAS